jgi:hypothetical protein
MYTACAGHVVVFVAGASISSIGAARETRRHDVAGLVVFFQSLLILSIMFLKEFVEFD